VFCSHGNRQPIPHIRRVLFQMGFAYADGTPIQTVAIEPDAEGRIAVIYVQRNPEKLLNVRHAGEK